MTRRPLLALCLAALAWAAPGPARAQAPADLVVALSMPTPGFQVGVVRGREVVLAKGYEIDLARAVAARLGRPGVRFVNEARFTALFSPGAKDWDLGIGQITITARRAEAIDFSRPYFEADQGVLLRSGLKLRARTLAALARLRLCALKGSTAADLIAERIAPRRGVRLSRDQSRLEADLYSRRCDAIVGDAPQLGVLRKQAPDRVGALAGRIPTGEQWAMTFPQGSPLRDQVDDAVRALERDGTLRRLARRWLTTDTGALPPFR
jgi:polar amino acid transport system substrate-binding protein